MSDHAHREQLIGLLRSASIEASRLHRSPQAERAAAELRRLSETGPPDLDALTALGWYHWLRQCTLPQGQASSEESMLAAQAFLPCFLMRPDIGDLPATALTVLAESIADPVAALVDMGFPPEEIRPEAVAELWSRMVAVTPQLSPNLVPRLGRLYEVTVGLDDSVGRDNILELFVHGLLPLFQAIPEGHPNRLAVWYLSGSAALLRYSERRQSADLDIALDRSRAVVKGLDDSDPLWTDAALLLGCGLLSRASTTPESSDVQEALRTLTQVDASLRVNGSPRGDVAVMLAIAESLDALHREDFTALLSAMDRVELDGDPELSTLRSLLVDFDKLFEGVLDDEEALAQAEQLHRRLLTTLDGDDRVEARLTLAWLLMSQTTGRDDPRLDEAIDLLELGMTEALGPETTRRAAQMLAMALHQRHGLRDDPADLDRGVRLVEEFGSGSAASHALLKARFDRLADRSTSTHDIRPADVFDVDFRFRQDSEHVTSILDLIAFIGTDPDVVTGSVTSTTVESIRPVIEALMSVSDVNDPRPFDDMIASLESTIAGLPADSRERPGVELLLLCVRGMRAAAADDSEAGADFVGRAQDILAGESLTPGVNRLLQAMVSQSTKLRALWERRDDGRVSAQTRDDAKQSVTGLVALSLDETNTASQRIDAARQAAELAHATGHPTAAAGALAVAVTLLPEAAPWHVRPDRRRRHFRRFTGVTSEAVGLTLAREDSTRADETALRLMEIGRGVLHHQIISSRSDLSVLQEAAPELAETYRGLISELSRDDTVPADEPEPRWRHLAAERLAHVKAKIRKLEGFAEFGGPPAIEQLRHEAADGPIVAINLSRHGCHALIVKPEGIQRVPLRRVNLVPATRYVNEFVTASNALYTEPAPSFEEFQRHRDTIRAVLSWAHHAITEPVLEHLGYRPTSSPDLPRLWWAPGGMLGLLPLHAAGDYSLERPVITADRVVSSYTPTIGQLRHVRAAAQRGGPSAARGFAVAMPNTPSHRPLPGATAEVAALRARWPKLIAPEDVLVDGQADRDAIVNRLKRMEVAHFACHASTDPTDPAASRIVLDDHAGRPLTVAELSLLDISNGRLAYLSACRTAHSSDGAMLDESLHLAAACQVGGFSHVIGTLWPVADDIASDFAVRCYRAMDNEGRLDPNLSARAVHRAMTELRNDLDRESPHLWAAWVHYGAL